MSSSLMSVGRPFRCLSQCSAPYGYSVQFQVIPVTWATASITFLPSRNTSGPIPSPGINATLYVATVPSFVSQRLGLVPASKPQASDVLDAALGLYTRHTTAHSWD